MISSDRKRYLSVFAALLAVDVVLILLHVLFGWSVINLDEEGTIAAWYSSVKLLSLALLTGFIWRAERDGPDARLRRFAFLWLAVGAIFLALSVDETASLHERVARYVMKESSVGLDIRETVLGGDATKDSFAWVLILSPFILGTIVFFLTFFYRRLYMARTGYVAALAGLSLFVLAVALEGTIYLTPSMKEWSSAELLRYRFFVGIEEGSEMLGSTLFLLGFLRYYARLMSRSATGPTA